VRSSILKQDISGATAAEQNNTSDGSVNSEEPDWQALYPFENKTDTDGDDDRSPSEAEETPQEETADNGIVKTIRSIEDKIDYYTTKLVFGRMNFIELNLKYNKIIGMNLISGADNVLVMKNSYFTFTSSECDTTKHAENLLAFKDKAQAQGIDFLYVQLPSKENKYDNMLLYNLPDYNNQNADSMLARLEGKGINYLDIRESIKEQKLDYYSLFFKTDHHWKPETGLWASGVIAEKINEISDAGIDTSVFDKSNYNFKLYEKFFLGTQGKHVTLAYTDPEDFTLVTPKVKTDFTVNYYNSRYGVKSGSFDETIINYDLLKKRDYYNTSQYSAYLYGDHAVISITNNLAKNDFKILVIGDSFSSSIVPFLAMGVKQVDKIDNRYFNVSIESYVEKNKPDMIIVEYNAAIFSSNDFSETFDFS
ncbi:MAG: DHHW family protein, partial [Acutalibacteraceae bacterium]